MRVGARRPVGVGARRLAGVGARRLVVVGAIRLAGVGAIRPVVVSAIRLAGVGAIGLALVGAVHAQTPTFEAIAIHPNHRGEVYRLRDFQIVGGPSWATGNPATAACASAPAPNGLPRCGTLTFRPGTISGRSVRIDQRPSEN